MTQSEKVLRRVRREVETEEWIEPRQNVEALGELPAHDDDQDESDDDDDDGQ